MESAARWLGLRPETISARSRRYLADARGICVEDVCTLLLDRERNRRLGESARSSGEISPRYRRDLAEISPRHVRPHAPGPSSHAPCRARLAARCRPARRPTQRADLRRERRVPRGESGAMYLGEISAISRRFGLLLGSTFRIISRRHLGLYLGDISAVSRQASSIQNYGVTCESFTLGHNPYKLPLSASAVHLPTLRRRRATSARPRSCLGAISARSRRDLGAISARSRSYLAVSCPSTGCASTCHGRKATRTTSHGAARLRR